MNQLTLRFDGGCRPTNPGWRYGSYSVDLDGHQVLANLRFELDWGTNNEAEFLALLRGLQDTLIDLHKGGFNPANYRLLLVTDSTIVRNRINGHTKGTKSEPQKRMATLTGQCLRCIDHFGYFEIEWEGRLANVARFGH